MRGSLFFVDVFRELVLRESYLAVRECFIPLADVLVIGDPAGECADPLPASP